MKSAVTDVWLALHVTRRWFVICITLTLSVFVVAAAAITAVASGEYVSVGNGRPDAVMRGLTQHILVLLGIGASGLFVTCISSILVFSNYRRGIVLDSIQSTVSWPASDIENSIFEVVTFKRFRNHLRREVVLLRDILDLRNDTIARSQLERYRLNISGNFGSRQLEFSSKQKRDECRTRVLAALKLLGHGASRDANFDGDGRI